MTEKNIPLAPLKGGVCNYGGSMLNWKDCPLEAVRRFETIGVFIINIIATLPK